MFFNTVLTTYDHKIIFLDLMGNKPRRRFNQEESKFEILAWLYNFMSGKKTNFSFGLDAG